MLSYLKYNKILFFLLDIHPLDMRVVKKLTTDFYDSLCKPLSLLVLNKLLSKVHLSAYPCYLWIIKESEAHLSIVALTRNRCLQNLVVMNDFSEHVHGSWLQKNWYVFQNVSNYKLAPFLKQIWVFSSLLSFSSFIIMNDI
jgi:hypothetical protein